MGKHDRAKQNPLVDGPPGWVNWRFADSGGPSLGASEVPLYSDAWITGEVSTGLGPYQFFNALNRRHGRGIVRTAVVLRAEIHLNFETPQRERTDPGFYYGGSLDDELAALASLLTGARFRPGGETRRFEPSGDPRGRPVGYGTRLAPVLTTTHEGIVLPQKDGDLSLMPLTRLQKYPTLEADDAVAVVRAARLYQDALWVAESEPNLAWVMLVSAVETAANRWHGTGEEPVVRLAASKPELVAYLNSLGSSGLAARIAEEFVDTLGATRKFIEFLTAHAPAAPSKRPDEWMQVDWSTTELQRAFRVIYGHRSRALHDGIPFPPPMCDAVQYIGRTEVAAERPTFIAAHQEGGTWLQKDVPMHLHIFEYIARHALVKWFEEIIAA